MAKKVNPDELPTNPRGVKPSYPWDQWTDGSWWAAEQGIDYKTSTRSFRSVLANHATKKGLRVSTRETDNGMAFQFRAREESK